MQLAQPVPSVTNWVELETGDKERDLCVRAVAPFPVKGGVLMRPPHFAFLLGHVAFVCEAREGKGL